MSIVPIKLPQETSGRPIEKLTTLINETKNLYLGVDYYLPHDINLVGAGTRFIVIGVSDVDLGSDSQYPCRIFGNGFTINGDASANKTTMIDLLVNSGSLEVYDTTLKCQSTHEEGAAIRSSEDYEGALSLYGCTLLSSSEGLYTGLIHLTAFKELIIDDCELMGPQSPIVIGGYSLALRPAVKIKPRKVTITNSLFVSTSTSLRKYMLHVLADNSLQGRYIIEISRCSTPSTALSITGVMTANTSAVESEQIPLNEVFASVTINDNTLSSATIVCHDGLAPFYYTNWVVENNLAFWGPERYIVGWKADASGNRNPLRVTAM